MTKNPAGRPLLSNVEDWRIPTPGTKSFAVYIMTLFGCNRKSIAQVIQSHPDTVGVLAYNMRHSSKHNADCQRYAQAARAKSANARRRKRLGQTHSWTSQSGV